ncbi:MAG: hypothetical protein Kow0083_11380 [Methylophaga sp.]
MNYENDESRKERLKQSLKFSITHIWHGVSVGLQILVDLNESMLLRLLNVWRIVIQNNHIIDVVINEA